MTPIEAHKRRILSCIKSNETRKARMEPKSEVKRNRYPRKRFRFDTPNIGEVSCPTRMT